MKFSSGWGRVLTKTGQSLVTLGTVVVLVFLLVRLIPGDPVKVILGVEATPESEAALRQQLQLGLGKEDAIELYYNAEITHWLSAALDLQIIDQALERTLNGSGNQLRDMNTAVVLGLRVYARFCPQSHGRFSGSAGSRGLSGLGPPVATGRF